MITVLTGLLAGLVHVLSGPDHLAAVAPLSAGERQPAWWIGLRWGLGHASGVVLVGVVAFLFRGLMPLELFSSWAERFVGVVLVGIGIWGVRRALQDRLHFHPHTHGREVHAHFHFHKPPFKKGRLQDHAHGHAVVGIGVLHGMAGGSHLLGVLPAMAFPTLGAGAGYLAAYAAGTLLAMTGFSGLIGLAVKGFAGDEPRRYRMCMIGSSMAAMGVGVVWLAG